QARDQTGQALGDRLCGVPRNWQVPQKTPAAGTECRLRRYWLAGPGPMTAVTVRIRTAILVAKRRKTAIPRWKRWRLQLPDRDKAQKWAYCRRNRDKLAAKSRIRHQRETVVNAGDL
ncbi:MAG: hypothetical protein WCK53_08840, partial [Methanomicrobiales archaeon]